LIVVTLRHLGVFFTFLQQNEGRLSKQSFSSFVEFFKYLSKIQQQKSRGINIFSFKEVLWNIANILGSFHNVLFDSKNLPSNIRDYFPTAQPKDSNTTLAGYGLMIGNFSSASTNVSDFVNETSTVDKITNLSDLKDILGTVKQTLDEGEKLTDSVIFSLIAIYSLVIVVGILGNILILWAVLGRDAMRTGRNVFIGTLATSDLFLCIFTMPSTLWEVRSFKSFASFHSNN